MQTAAPKRFARGRLYKILVMNDSTSPSGLFWVTSLLAIAYRLLDAWMAEGLKARSISLQTRELAAFARAIRRRKVSM